MENKELHSNRWSIVTCILCWLSGYYHLNRGTAFRIRLHMCPAKTQISLRVCAVWSESSQDIRSVIRLTTRTVIMCRRVSVSAWRTCNIGILWSSSFVSFTMRLAFPGKILLYHVYRIVPQRSATSDKLNSSLSGANVEPREDDKVVIVLCEIDAT